MSSASCVLPCDASHLGDWGTSLWMIKSWIVEPDRTPVGLCLGIMAKLGPLGNTLNDLKVLTHLQHQSNVCHRGSHFGKWYRNVPKSWPHFFQDNRCPLAYQFIINAPLMCPHFKFLEKWCIFNLVLAKISALKVQIFQIFIPKTPHFSRKICSLDPTFGNPCGTHP